MKKRKVLIGALFLLGTSVCSSQNIFADIAQTAGLSQTPESEGVSVGDFNNDGWEDLYIGFRNGRNQLWKNNGDGTFSAMHDALGPVNATNTAAKTAIWGDVDNDGDLDLYVGNVQAPDHLFRNNGDESFTEVSQESGIFQYGYPLSVNMADVDNDGWLDVYVSNIFQQNVMYMNKGDGTFYDATYVAGALDEGRAMGGVFFDYDNDGDSDLYLVHDGMEPNFLYQNDGSGKFTDVGAAAGVNTRSFGMGVDVGDVNNDGFMDIYVTNLYHNFLFLNKGDGTFSEIGAAAGVDDNGMGWGVSMFDYDNDGWLDIYVANDYYFSKYPNVLYRNLGNLHFEKVETKDPISNLLPSYGTACFDYNADGAMDVAVANRGKEDYVQLFKNAVRPGNWIRFKLIGVAGNRQSIGAKIRLTDGQGRLHYDEMTAGNGWLSQNSGIFHFGLGEGGSIENAVVIWPSGLQQPLGPLEPNKSYTLVEGGVPKEGILNLPVTKTEALSDHLALDAVVSPNPSEGAFRIRCRKALAGILSIRILSPLGQTLWTENMQAAPAGETDFTPDPSVLRGLSYCFVLVSDGEKTLARKLVFR